MNTIPYFINVVCNEGTKIKTYTGSYEKNELYQKILEEIAELMVLYSEMKRTGPDIIESVMYFENDYWNAFDISVSKEKLMIIYEEKYNNFYVESEEEMSDTSEDSLEERWDTILGVYQECQNKIYETHLRLMEELENDGAIIYI
jgi:hypothetical protein